MMKRKVRASRCPWRTPEITDAIKTRDYYLRKAKKSGADNHWCLYKNARNKVNRLIRKSKAKYHRSLISENAKDPKNFWKAVKQVYPMKETPPSNCKAFEISGKLIDNKRDIANSFCEFFVSQAARLCELLPNQFKWQNTSDIVQTPHRFNFRPVTKAKVLRNLNNLKASKSAGPDNLPPRLLKDAAEALAGPLTHLINLSFKHSTFPKRLKIAKVIPLFKSGPRKNLDNYRPISILPILSKIFERIAYEQFAEHLENNELIVSTQFGFRKRYNTELAVTVFTDSIRKSIDQGKMTGAVFIDLRKAFDTVEHSILLQKLPYYGIRDAELNWMKSYLKERRQFVHYDGESSDVLEVEYGVPQGSILGPLLFLLHINDLVKAVKNCQVLMYADDTVIYTSSQSITEIERALTNEMENISKWLDNNRLVINLKKGKTEVMLFGTAKRRSMIDGLNIFFGDKRINVTDSYKYLGTYLDQSLNMRLHLDKVYKKASSKLKLLSRMRPLLTRSAAESVYKAVIVPGILYCSTPVLKIAETDCRKFESLQNRALKIIYGKQQKDCKLMSIESSKKYKACLLVFKCLKRTSIEVMNTCLEPLNHNQNTRNNKYAARIPRVRTEAGKKAFWFQGPKLYNELPSSLRQLDSFIIFKHKLKQFYMDN